MCMNIETAIKSRKDAFFAAYDIKDESLLKEIESSLMLKIRKLLEDEKKGVSCNDNNWFFI